MYTTYVQEQLSRQRAEQLARENEIMRRRSERPVMLGATPTTTPVRSGVLHSIARWLHHDRPVAGH
jgi:hypothetical protein